MSVARSLALLVCLLFACLGLPSLALAQQTGGDAGEYLNYANPTDGSTPTVLSTWSAMQRQAPTPASAIGASSRGTLFHGHGFQLPPALLSPSLAVVYDQSGGTHSYVGRGWSISSGLTVRRPAAGGERAYLSEGGKDALVVQGDGLDGVLILDGSTWVWESATPSSVHLTEKTNGNLVVRAGNRKWTLQETTKNVWRTTKSEDRSGNRIDYEWSEIEGKGSRLDRIKYGGSGTGPSTIDHVVWVDLVYRPTEHDSYSARDGELELIDERLDYIDVQTRPSGLGAPQSRLTYLFNYSDGVVGYAAEDEQLWSIEEASSILAADVRLREAFDYHEPDLDLFEKVAGANPRWIGTTGTFPDTDKRASVQTRTTLMDFTHDGLPDVVDGFDGLEMWPMVRPVDTFIPSFFDLSNSSSVEVTQSMEMTTATPGGLDDRQIRVHESWVNGTDWGANSSFTTLKLADVDGDGLVDRIRAMDADLYLDDDNVMHTPDHAGGTSAYKWEICWGDFALDAYENCDGVDAPFVVPQVGRSKVVPYASSFNVTQYDNHDLIVDLVDMDNDGWLDILYHDGVQIYYYPKLPATSATDPVDGRRSTGWARTEAGRVFAGTWYIDGSPGMAITTNYVDAEAVSLQGNLESYVPAVKEVEATSTLRDINGDGLVDLIKVDPSFASSGDWLVRLGDGEGFSNPIDWPAPQPYITKSWEGKPEVFAITVTFVTQNLDPLGPGTEAELFFFDTGWDVGGGDRCNWTQQYLNTDGSSTYVAECNWHAFYGESGREFMDRQLNEEMAETLDLGGVAYTHSFGDPRFVASDLVDMDADGIPDFFDGWNGL